MKKLLRIIGSILGALVAVFVVGGLILPASSEINVTVEVDAPREDMFTLANTPATWVNWSAWNLEAMPDMKSSYTGPDSGLGARWSWQQEVGDGWLEITESTQNQRVGYDLVFGDTAKPWSGDIQFIESDNNTIIKWAFGGDVGMNLMGRWMLRGMASIMEAEHIKGAEGLAAAARARAQEVEAAGDDDSASGDRPMTGDDDSAGE